MITVKLVSQDKASEMRFGTPLEAFVHFRICQSNPCGHIKITVTSVTRDSVSLHEERPLLGPEDITYTGPEEEMAILQYAAMHMFQAELQPAIERLTAGAA